LKKIICFVRSYPRCLILPRFTVSLSTTGMNVQGVSPSAPNSKIVKGVSILTWQRVSLSTTCSMNVQGVSLSAPSSIIVKGVSIPMLKTVLTGQRVSLSNEHAGCTHSIIVKGVSIPMPKKVLTWQRVSLSTTCSMNMEGVSTPMPTVLTWQRVSLSTTSMNVQYF